MLGGLVMSGNIGCKIPVQVGGAGTVDLGLIAISGGFALILMNKDLFFMP